MEFIRQYEKGTGNWGTNLLTIAISLGAVLLGSAVSAILMSFLGMDYSPSEERKNLQLALMIVPFIFLIIALLACVKFLHRRPLKSTFTARNQFDWKRYFFAFSVWMMVLGGTLFLGYALNDPIEWNVNWSTFFPLVLVSLVMLPLQTAAEDLFFRGLLLQSFHQWFGKTFLSILFSGLLFGFVHMGNPEIEEIGQEIIIYYISVGVFLALITHLDNGLELGMGYHAANNIFAALIITNDWQAFRTDALFIDHSPPGFGWDIVFSLLVIHPMILLLFSKVYRWKNWKSILS